jgi:hypothetical protein
VDSTDTLLRRDAAWHPAPEAIPRWLAEAAAKPTSPALEQELRWWEAWAAARAADWDRVSALAQGGFGEPFSEREGIRLALLHALSGDLAQAEHVLSQVVQWNGDATLLSRFADACAAEGLAEGAARFRRISAPGR